MFDPTARLRDLCLISACLCVAGFSSHNDRGVRDRFDAYVSAWRNQNYQAVWEMMSPRQKVGNENSETKFAEYVKKQGIYVSGATISSVNVIGDVATIGAYVKYASPTEGPLGGEREVFRFIRINGIWYFDDYRTVGAPGEPKSDEIHR